MSKLLEEYIKLALGEAHLARVPQQLTPPTDIKKEDEEADDSVEEASGTGAIAGYVLPLGMSPDSAGRKKNKV